MCHLLQNSIIDVDMKGLLKLFGNLIPNNNPKPKAISVYPSKIKINLKSKTI